MERRYRQSTAVRKQKRKEQILQAAARIFARKSYWETDMESICRQARLAKGTVYLYFNSKEELFTCLIESILNKFLVRIRDLLEQKLSVLPTLEKLMTLYLDFFQEHSAYFTILFLETPGLHTRLATHFWQKFLSSLKPLENRYEQAVISGQVRDVPFKDAIFMLVGLLQSVIYQWLLCSRRYQLVSRASTVKTVLFHGLVEN